MIADVLAWFKKTFPFDKRLEKSYTRLYILYHREKCSFVYTEALLYIHHCDNHTVIRHFARREKHAGDFAYLQLPICAEPGISVFTRTVHLCDQRAAGARTGAALEARLRPRAVAADTDDDDLRLCHRRIHGHMELT